MFNMMKMMSDGRNGEDGAGSPELSGLMEAMGGTGGALPHGKDPFEGLQNLDVSSSNHPLAHCQYY